MFTHTYTMKKKLKKKVTNFFLNLQRNFRKKMDCLASLCDANPITVSSYGNSMAN